MTKQTYMHKLEEALSKCTPEFRAEILADYEDYFRGGLLEGKSEEEICLQLGNIEDFVKEIPVECYLSEESHGTYIPANSGNDSQQVLQPSAPAAAFDSETASDSAEKSAPAMIKKVIINTGSIDTQICRSYDSSVKVDTDIRYHLKYEGNTCIIELIPPSPRTFIGIFNVQIGGDAEIRIPTSVEALEIHGVSGDIEIEDLQLNELQLITSSGDQSLSHVRTKALSISTASGDIEVDSCLFDVMTLQSASGDQEVTNTQAQAATFGSSSGNITCQDVKICVFTASCSSGDIEISNDISATASLGTSSGDITYFDRTGNGYQGKIRTRSGDYTLYFNGDEFASGSGQNTISCGAGVSVLDVSTASGDIEING